MRVCVSSKIIVLLIGFCAAILVGAGSAKADFTFGTPTNLGPVVNSSAEEHPAGMSADGLRLYFSSRRTGGTSEWYDIWVSTRQTKDDPWEEPVSLGPAINTSRSEFEPDISPDELILVFTRAGTDPPDWDIWMSTRPTRDDPWGERQNLGTMINSPVEDMDPSISADGLTLYFNSKRSGGHGATDIMMATRPTINDPWSEAVNLGQTVNTSYSDWGPEISADGLTLFFNSNRPGSIGGADFYMTRRPTINDPWSTPVNLGAGINSSGSEQYLTISADERLFLFSSNRSGGQGGSDIWQVPIIPILDLNGDLKIDLADMQIILDHWGENYSLCDIGPTPFGDCIVDIQDMIVLAENLYRFTAHWKLDEAEGGIAYDSVGDYDGTVNGNPPWQPAGGMKGGTLLLDGIDDYIETPFILDPTDESFSVFAWIMCWTPGQVIISQSNTNGNRSPISGSTWLGTTPSDGKLMTGLMPPPAGWVNPQPLVSESVITDMQWHHVGFVWDGSCRALYVDGIEVAKDSYAQNPLNSSEGGLYIGASNDLDAGTLFSGFMDDIRIYKQALGEEEIEILTQ
jgi:hypothetical protein